MAINKKISFCGIMLIEYIFALWNTQLYFAWKL
jgi:hypothetical protein